MFKLRRNQVIITSLVVMIAVAGYLNYIDEMVDIPEGFAYNQDGSISALVTDMDELANNIHLQEQEVIPADIAITPLPPTAIEDLEIVQQSTPSDTGEAMFVNATRDDSTFFVQARLDREQSRARQREVLLELINNDNIDQEVKAESADAMLTIQRRIEKESATEALIESKGFNEVFVRIGDNSVDVIVNKETLTDAELAQIEDIIKRKTGVESDIIRISPMNNAN